MMMSRWIATTVAAVLLLVSTAQAAPAICPGQDDSSLLGYSDLTVLQEDLNEFALNEQVGVDYSAATTTSSSTTTTSSAQEAVVFRLCPNTTFQLSSSYTMRNIYSDNVDSNGGDPPLHLYWSKDLPPVVLECGDSSKEENNVDTNTNTCIIQGGLHHLWIDQVSAFTVRGITFLGAERGSIWAGMGLFDIKFENCIWKDNTYTLSSTTTDQCATGCAAALGGLHGAVSFTNCQFVNNQGNSGAVYGKNMQYAFDKCIFQGNTATGRMIGDKPTGSAITLLEPSSTLSLTDSCFVDNQSFGSATVALDAVPSQTAEMTGMTRTSSGSAITSTTTPTSLYSNNYFANNAVAQPLWDSAYFYCHNSVYHFLDVEGVTDQCVSQGITAECCRANLKPTDACPSEEDMTANRDVLTEVSGVAKTVSVLVMPLAFVLVASFFGL